ncbi:MAG: 16S rRNA (cytidine(1402)-2'-O)-methyltransferase [Methylococcales bacterium]|nr:16S rRNA (cytidine(1402)-2'-O)-methyltransferase [Methylococcales bacterium]
MTQEIALYVVATPIGNLNDITLRALEVLAEVDLVAAEDTRHTQQLLKHHGIKTKLLSLHDHNESARVETVIKRLQQGDSIALVSDAGTPLISDPGFVVVNAVRDAGLLVVPIPGPSALVAALSVSGVAVMPFAFYGFLPRTTSARQSAIGNASVQNQTSVFYEASHRIVDMLEDIAVVCGGERSVVLAKEMTKLHEALVRAPVSEVLEWLAEDHKRQKGEFVVLLERPKSEAHPYLLNIEQILKPLAEDLPPKQAAALAATMTGLKKNDLYRLVMQWKEERK